MRRLLLAAAATVLLSTPTFAADLAPVPAEPVAPAYLPFTWTGFYVGGNVGYGFGNDEDSDISDSGGRDLDSFGLDADGFFVGAQVGANYQMDSFVIGIEADIQKSWMDDSIHVSPYGFDDSLDASVDIDWFGTVRARAGIAWDRVLVYGTGGLAFGSIDYNARIEYDAPLTAKLSSDDVEWGWVLGAGVEYALTDNWTVKGEYQYINLGDVTASGPIRDDDGDDTGDTARSSRDIDFHTVRIGINYKF